jgi:hypothetical protein
MSLKGQNTTHDTELAFTRKDIKGKIVNLEERVNLY